MEKETQEDLLLIKSVAEGAISGRIVTEDGPQGTTKTVPTCHEKTHGKVFIKPIMENFLSNILTFERIHSTINLTNETGELKMKTNQKIEDKIVELKENEKQNVNHGEIIVIRAYLTTNESTESDILVLDRGMFTEEMPEVIQALHDYEVTEFIFADSSTALMQNLHDFMKAGFKVEGPAEYKRVTPWKEDGIVEKGLLMKLA